ncbi:MAG TPA: AraC family transcriptional regulator [Cellvibrionaceae bacterium]
MAKSITLETYRNRVMQVVDHLWKHLDRDTDINTLAEVACFSPYHFHRIYREMMHETVFQTVKRLRLHRAACLLVRTGDTVESIAKSVNYGSAEAFTRAFAAHYGDSPHRYRQGHRQVFDNALLLPETAKEYPMKHRVTIENLPLLHLAGMPHKGDYLDIGAVFEKLFISASSLGLVNDTTRSFGIYYDDPFTTPTEDLRSLACITVDNNTNTRDLQSANIGGGKHAVLSFTGPYAELEAIYEWFYGHWLPESGHELADAPPFEEYLNDPKTTPANELITKIYLPLKA